MMTTYMMKNPNLTMTAKFDTYANRQQAMTLFAATLGRPVGMWEIIIKNN